MGFIQYVTWPAVCQDDLFISVGLLLFDNSTHGYHVKQASAQIETGGRSYNLERK